MLMSAVRYNTNQRKLILAVIERNRGRHITAEEVHLELIRAGSPVGKATVYRHFERLEKEGLLIRYAPVEGAGACWEYAGEPGEVPAHYHMKCESCGKLFCLDCTFLDTISNHFSEHHKFDLNRFRTVFYGICSECRGKDKDEN
ncbi:MAG TPA: transcriptional repressor [Synergistaceae bacterium]|jgi:Fur family transcriptional regulator, ferric uptake regulator|nr:transcriptional repressor [Synergistaceae bacterium]